MIKFLHQDLDEHTKSAQQVAIKLRDAMPQVAIHHGLGGAVILIEMLLAEGESAGVSTPPMRDWLIQALKKRMFKLGYRLSQ